MPLTSSPEDYISTAVQLTQFNARQAIFMAFWSGFVGLFSVTFILLSTPAQRRRPLFAIQCGLLTLTLIYNGIDLAYTYLYTANWIEQLGQNRSQPTPWPEAEPTLYIMSQLLPFLIDLTLIIKVAAFYPRRVYHVTWKRLLPVAPLVVLALARLATLIYSSQQWYLGYVTLNAKVGTQVSPDNPLWIAELRATRNATKAALAELCLQIIFCAYACGMLLYKAISFLKHVERSPTLKRSVIFLLEATFMSFLPPLIVQLIAVGLTASTTSSKSVMFASAYCRSLNVYFSMVFSVLATSWSTIRGALVSSHASERSAAAHLKPFEGRQGVLGGAVSHSEPKRKEADRLLITSLLTPVMEDASNLESMEILRTEVFQSPPGWTQEHKAEVGTEEARL